MNLHSLGVGLAPVDGLQGGGATRANGGQQQDRDQDPAAPRGSLHHSRQPGIITHSGGESAGVRRLQVRAQDALLPRDTVHMAPNWLQSDPCDQTTPRTETERVSVIS